MQPKLLAILWNLQGLCTCYVLTTDPVHLQVALLFTYSFQVRELSGTQPLAVDPECLSIILLWALTKVQVCAFSLAVHWQQ